MLVLQRRFGVSLPLEGGAVIGMGLGLWGPFTGLNLRGSGIDSRLGQIVWYTGVGKGLR